MGVIVCSVKDAFELMQHMDENDMVVLSVIDRKTYILLSVKLDAPDPCRLVASDLDLACRASADCLPQHLQVI